MKTLFVVCSAKVNKHVGEDYDEILEVENQPTTETIQDWANRIKGCIRTLWHAQVQPGDPDAAAVNPKVVVHLESFGGTKEPVGTIVEHLGKAGEHRVEMNAIVLEHGFRMQFPLRCGESTWKRSRAGIRRGRSSTTR